MNEPIHVWMVLFQTSNQSNYDFLVDPTIRFYKTADLGSIILSVRNEDFTLAQCIKKSLATPADCQDYQIMSDKLLGMHIVIDEIHICHMNQTRI